VIQPVLVGSQIRHPLGSPTIEHLFVQAWSSDFSIGISNDPEMDPVIRDIRLCDCIQGSRVIFDLVSGNLNLRDVL